MNSVKSEILGFFENADMRFYINNIFDTLSPQVINDIICGAPISLERKLELLSKLSEDNQVFKDSAKSIQIALSLLESSENEFFIVSDQYFDEEEKYDTEIFTRIFMTHPFKSFEKAQEYFTPCYISKDSEPSEKEINSMYVLEKWRFLENGNSVKIMDYYISHQGDILFYSLHYDAIPEKAKTKDIIFLGENENTCSESQDLNLPIPFKVGDIITANCTPFARKRDALILEIGDNMSCCSVQCLYVDAYNNIHVGALKHNWIFEEYEENPLLSSLYRLALAKDISKKNKPLKKLAKFLKGSEERGKALKEYLSENHRYDCYNHDIGLKYKELKKSFLNKYFLTNKS